MRRLVAALAATLLLLSLAAGPAAASPKVPLVGDPIGVYLSGTRDYPADTPFHTQNGFCTYAAERSMLLDPSTRIELAIDGRPIVLGTILDLHSTDYPDCSVAKFGYHNFRFGMPAGTYRFETHWYWQGDLFWESDVLVTFS